jgi:hypothetical protein
VRLNDETDPKTVAEDAGISRVPHWLFRSLRALLKVFGEAEHTAIRDIISTIDHIQGDPRMVRSLRSQLRTGKITAIAA